MITIEVPKQCICSRASVKLIHTFHEGFSLLYRVVAYCIYCIYCICCMCICSVYIYCMYVSIVNCVCNSLLIAFQVYLTEEHVGSGCAGGVRVFTSTAVLYLNWLVVK